MQAQYITAPRVLFQHFKSHKGAPVMIVGKVTSYEPDENAVFLQMNSQKTSVLEVNFDPRYVQVEEFEGLNGTYVEVTGISDGNKTIEIREFCPFGETFDLATYNELVQLMNNQFKHLFR